MTKQPNLLGNNVLLIHLFIFLHEKKIEHHLITESVLLPRL